MPGIIEVEKASIGRQELVMYEHIKNLFDIAEVRKKRG